MSVRNLTADQIRDLSERIAGEIVKSLDGKAGQAGSGSLASAKPAYRPEPPIPLERISRAVENIATKITYHWEPESTCERLADLADLVVAVLQRGWVVVGRYGQEGRIVTLQNAAVVRVWGTDQGLGQLAREGPRVGTILDDCPDVSFHVRECILLMRAREEAWKDWCERNAP